MNGSYSIKAHKIKITYKRIKSFKSIYLQFSCDVIEDISKVKDNPELPTDGECEKDNDNIS